MKVIIEGVQITLTPEQIEIISKFKKEKEKATKSFKTTLQLFGFKQLPKQKESFEFNGWYAEIIDRGGWQEVWLTGKGLKTSGFPGGWIYSSPAELSEELARAVSSTSPSVG